MAVITVHVPAMTCRRRAREVSAALRDVPGVRTVAVDLASATVTVVGAVSREAIHDALDCAGYTIGSGRQQP